MNNRSLYLLQSTEKGTEMYQSIPKVLQEDEIIKDAFEVAKFSTLDKDKQFAYQQSLKARLDYVNVMNYARKEAREEGLQKGREEGLEKGREEEKIEIAKNMLLAKLDNELISQTIGLSTEKIERLRKDIR